MNGFDQLNFCCAKLNSINSALETKAKFDTLVDDSAPWNILQYQYFRLI